MTIKEKTKFVSAVFYYGGKRQLKEEWVWVLAASIGLIQGLKYKGDIKTGLLSGVATLATLAGVSGILNVIHNEEKIKEVFKEV